MKTNSSSFPPTMPTGGKGLRKTSYDQGSLSLRHDVQPYQSEHPHFENRLVMAPMGNISMCDETGRPNAKMLKYFEERARGGTGLLTSGLIPVSFGIDKSLIELGDLSYFPRIDRSRTVLPLGEILRA